MLKTLVSQTSAFEHGMSVLLKGGAFWGQQRLKGSEAKGEPGFCCFWRIKIVPVRDELVHPHHRGC